MNSEQKSEEDALHTTSTEEVAQEAPQEVKGLPEPPTAPPTEVQQPANPFQPIIAAVIPFLPQIVSAFQQSPAQDRAAQSLTRLQYLQDRMLEGMLLEMCKKFGVPVAPPSESETSIIDHT